MSSHTQTWCDICQQDEHVDHSRALSLPGNDQDWMTEGKWPNGYGPMDIDDLVWEHGWVVFTRKRHVPEQHYESRGGKPGVVIAAYDTTDELEVCAHCLADPDVDIHGVYGGRSTTNVSPWVVKPHLMRNQENYDKAIKAREEVGA